MKFSVLASSLLLTGALASRNVLKARNPSPKSGTQAGTVNGHKANPGLTKVDLAKTLGNGAASALSNAADDGSDDGGDNTGTTTFVAGAITDGSYAGEPGGLYMVTGTITAPTIGSYDDPNPIGGSLWVGLDNGECSSVQWEAGMDWYTDADSGELLYAAWYDWAPDYAYYIDADFEILEGDVVTFTIVADSTTGGTAYFDNLSSGQSVSYALEDQGAVGELCGNTAEWFIQDFASEDDTVDFPNFGVIQFSGLAAEGNAGTIDATGATIISMTDADGNPIVDCEQDDSATVTCYYSGPN